MTLTSLTVDIFAYRPKYMKLDPIVRINIHEILPRQEHFQSYVVDH
jgi:hypothetical protein